MAGDLAFVTNPADDVAHFHRLHADPPVTLCGLACSDWSEAHAAVGCRECWHAGAQEWRRSYLRESDDG